MQRVLAFLLLAIALFMGVGFLRSGAPLTDPVTWVALVIAVGVPGAAGAVLLAGGLGGGRARRERTERLRRETLDAELLRLAGERSGKLTVVEAVTALGVTPEEAKAALSSLVTRELADIEVTDSGLLVYAFGDVGLLGEKSTARDVLDV